MLEVGQEVVLPSIPDYKLIIIKLVAGDDGSLQLVKIALICRELTSAESSPAERYLLNHYITNWLTDQLGYRPKAVSLIFVFVNGIHKIDPALEFGDFEAFEEIVTALYHQMEIR